MSPSSRSAGGRSPATAEHRADWRTLRRLGAATLRPSDDPLPDDAIRDTQRGGAGRGGAAQHVAGNGANTRDRSEHRGGLVVDGFLMEVDDAAGIRQIVRHEHDATYRQRRRGFELSLSLARASLDSRG